MSEPRNTMYSYVSELGGICGPFFLRPSVPKLRTYAWQPKRGRRWGSVVVRCGSVARKKRAHEAVESPSMPGNGLADRPLANQPPSSPSLLKKSLRCEGGCAAARAQRRTVLQRDVALVGVDAVQRALIPNLGLADEAN